MTPTNDNTAQQATPALQVQLPGVGTVLREARESTSQSVTQIAARLRIKAEYIQALEDDKPENLPGRVYAIGFLRSYATYLDLDPLDLIRRYKAIADANPRPAELNFPKPAADRRQSPELPAIVMSVLVIAAVLFGWYYLGSAGNPLAVNISVQEAPSQAPSRAPSPAASLLPAVVTPTIVERSVVEPNVDEPNVDEPDVVEPDVVESSVVDPAAEPDIDIAVDRAATSADTTDRATPDTPAPVEVASVDATPEPETSTLPPPPTAATHALLPAPVQIERPVRSRPPATAPATEQAEDQDPGGNGLVTADATPQPVPEPNNEPPAEQVAEALARQSPARQSTTAVADPEPAPEPRVVAALPQPPAAPQPFDQVLSPTRGAAPTESDVVAPRAFGQINRDSRIVLTARTAIWVQVRDADGANVFTQMLGEGESYRVPNRPGLRLLTGNAGALDVYIDGKQAPSLGDFGMILRDLELDADRLARTTARNSSVLDDLDSVNR